MASKVPACAELARQAVEQQGMCVVIGLQSTGEANMNACWLHASDARLRFEGPTWCVQAAAWYQTIETVHSADGFSAAHILPMPASCGYLIANQPKEGCHASAAATASCC